MEEEIICSCGYDLTSFFARYHKRKCLVYLVNGAKKIPPNVGLDDAMEKLDAAMGKLDQSVDQLSKTIDGIIKRRLP